MATVKIAVKTTERITIIGPPDLVEKAKSVFRNTLIPNEAIQIHDFDMEFTDKKGKTVEVIQRLEKVHSQEHFEFKLVGKRKFTRIKCQP